MQGYLIGILIFAIATAIFVLQNTAPVAIQFITWHSPKVSIAVVALIAMLVGALLTYLINGARYLKMGKNVRDLQNKNRKLEKQLQKAAATTEVQKPPAAITEEENKAT